MSTHHTHATRRLVSRAVVAAALLVGAAFYGAGLPTTSAHAATSFSFGAVGDHGGGSNNVAVMRQAGAANLDLFLSLGDFAYDDLTPSAWCRQVKDSINAGAGLAAGSAYGETFPFELVTGNHDEDQVSAYTGCLPDRLGATPSGGYGREFYVDYPSGAPLARFIMTSPGDGYEYTAGNAHYRWLSDAIDSARAAGVRWVVVGNHKNYIDAGAEHTDEIGSDYFNLLVAKRVDLILQGHEHTYQRSKQLALSSGCSAVPTGTYNASCVANDGATGSYAKGAGTVLLIDGTGGKGNYPIDAGTADAGYFARTMGSNSNNTYGFTKFTVTEQSLSATFVRGTGGTFSDGFTIGQAVSDTSPPSAPSGLTATAVTASRVDLGWHAATDDHGVAGYRVYRDGVQVGSSAGTTYSDTTVAGGTTYRYTTRAYDLGGNLGPESVSATVTTPATTTATFTPSDDATVSQASPSANDGNDAYLGVDNSPVQHVLLKFTVAGTAGRTVTGARLRLYNVNGSNVAGVVHRVSSNAWNEGSVTWNNAPAADAASLATGGAADFHTWVDLDVSSLVTGDGTYSVRVDTPSSDQAEYRSSEYSTADTRPQVVVTTQLGAPDTTPPTAPTGLVAPEITASTAELGWSPATDDRGVAAYRVYRDGTQVTETPDLVYTDTALAPATTYGYTVRALDNAGNLGPASATLSVTTATTDPVPVPPVPPVNPVTVTSTPTDDATITQASPTLNDGSDAYLGIDNSPVQHMLLKFTVAGTAGRTVTGTTLRLYNVNPSNVAGVVHRVSSNAWSQGTVTWSNAPAADAARLAAGGAVAFHAWVDLDVTGLVSGDGTYTVRIDTTSTDGAEYRSSEYSTADTRPQLVVTAQ